MLEFAVITLVPGADASIERIPDVGRRLDAGISSPVWHDDGYLYFGTPGAVMRCAPAVGADWEIALLGQQEEGQPGEALSSCIGQ